MDQQVRNRTQLDYLLEINETLEGKRARIGNQIFHFPFHHLHIQIEIERAARANESSNENNSKHLISHFHRRLSRVGIF